MLGSPLRWKAIAKELSSVVSSSQRRPFGVGFRCQPDSLTKTRFTWSFPRQCRSYSAPSSQPRISTPSAITSTARKSTRFDPRFFSSNVNAAEVTGQLPVLSSPGVGGWLLGSAGLVFAVIVVGGITRLTESGLSITEWRPIAGAIPPLNREEWMVEFEKYKATPEFKLCVISANFCRLRALTKGWYM